MQFLSKIRKSLQIFFHSFLCMCVSLFFSIGGYGHIVFPNRSAERIDLTNREVIWGDEFEGDALDTSKWTVFDTNGHTTFFTPDQVTVDDGCARLRIEYHKDGKWGDGFYGGWLSTENSFQGTYGYYEIRCKMPKGEGLHAAFWTYKNQFSYNHTAKSGTEIDIFENAFRRVKQKNEAVNRTYQITLHAGDGHGKHLSISSPKISTLERDGTDMYNSFHTYGLEWTDKAYIFYYDGIEVERFDFSNGPIDGFDGTCEEPMHLFVSTHVGSRILDDGSIDPEWNGNAFNNPSGTFPTDFVVDYVRVYAPEK